MKNILKMSLITVLIIIMAVSCGEKKEKLPEIDKGEVIENFATKISTAISKAILLNNKGKYLEGECTAEGHEVLQTEDVTSSYRGEDGKKFIKVYCLTTYGEYSFFNGSFAKISGSGVIPAVITLSKNNEGKYDLINYQVPEDGSGYTESIKSLFLEELYEDVLTIDDDIKEELKEQEYEYAKTYLESINRVANICETSEVETTLINTYDEVSNEIFKKYTQYPDFAGSIEKIESGIRYVYETKWENVNGKDGTITFTKYEYDTKNEIQKLVFKIENGKSMSM